MITNLSDCFLQESSKIEVYNCCGPVKGPEEKYKLGIMWNKYIEQKYKYSIGKRVLNVSLTAKVFSWS